VTLVFLPAYAAFFGAIIGSRLGVGALLVGGDRRASLRLCGYRVLYGLVCLTLGARVFQSSAKST